MPEDSPGFLLWQTTTIWQRKIKKELESYNISHAQFVIMATLMWFDAHGYDTTQISIVKWTKLDKMTVSKALAKLAAQNYVSRMEHEVDTRAKSIAITNEGKALVRRLVPIVEGVDEKFFGQLSVDEQKRMITLLKKLVVVI